MSPATFGSGDGDGTDADAGVGRPGLVATAPGPAQPTDNRAGDNSAPGYDADSTVSDGTDHPRRSGNVPELSAADAIRFREPRGSIRYLWPTDAATSLPFVGLVVGFDGTRYPLYLDRETSGRLCRAPFDVVSAETLPVDPPPHARVFRDGDS